MAHEFLHVGLAHGERRQGRDPYLWNVACDFAINDWLVEMRVGAFPTLGGLLDPELRGLSAEAIYASHRHGRSAPLPQARDPPGRRPLRPARPGRPGRAGNGFRPRRLVPLRPRPGLGAALPRRARPPPGGSRPGDPRPRDRQSRSPGTSASPSGSTASSRPSSGSVPTPAPREPPGFDARYSR